MFHPWRYSAKLQHATLPSKSACSCCRLYCTKNCRKERMESDLTQVCSIPRRGYQACCTCCPCWEVWLLHWAPCRQQEVHFIKVWIRCYYSSCKWLLRVYGGWTRDLWKIRKLKMIELNNLGEFSVLRRPLEGFVGRTSLSMGWGYICSYYMWGIVCFEESFCYGDWIFIVICWINLLFKRLIVVYIQQ